MATWGFPGKQSAEMGIDREALREAAPAASPPPSPLLGSWGVRSKCQAQKEEEERLGFQAP